MGWKIKVGSFFQHFCQNSVGRKLPKSQNSAQFLAKTPPILRKTQFSGKNIKLLLHKSFCNTNSWIKHSTKLQNSGPKLPQNSVLRQWLLPVLPHNG